MLVGGGALCVGGGGGSLMHWAVVLIMTNLSQVTISNDNVFGDNTSAQITQMTPSMSGSVSSGYTATATIGLAV
jgi:hypothetical protein